MPIPPASSLRETRRLETRARLSAAALDEISRRGLAGADVSSIAAAAGVVRGTFYFHFPTKEHVLIEVERTEETRIVSELGAAAGPLESVLARVVELVLDAERRLGAAVFRDMLGLHFSSTRPVEDELGRHPLAQFLVGVISRAQDGGQVSPDADSAELSMFFLTGLFALLATGAHDAALLNRYVTTIVKGMERS
ncbi:MULTISPECIES: TetR/AcrR family transcriptional regulator [Mycobacterium]|uniref:TetR family transcriptional regulator n=1 Tax=Mycobacterium kiyosense TaxID=2871094 RepID=A0A9P3UVJ0_9MYCO|nr:MULTISPECIES: TetR/AcrR family transcriptional regulator [Mycobacterium]BDB44746.1 TetR family transcriptional regulator [Mycobacterium kiyosense]BDE16242.1 TetR family transcriptional regulator [Mycobacterium sp. 20KCMC460]GLB86066.1 TetR family transcriptional regulator [Mycobacterium kiyosense]GLB92771.1 TetR family transcriptional regulator [Mycobacterium kiyosense]GLB98686.1 TetR family transcriptional regulator [Mycobacterium kiyosense]